MWETIVRWKVINNLSSFWENKYIFFFGVLAGILLFWIFHRIIESSRIFSSIRAQINKHIQKRSYSSGLKKYQHNLIQIVQSQHLASNYFPLDEIIVPPIILAPRPTQAIDPSLVYEDIVHLAIPEMPDSPHLDSLFGAPTLTLIEAISGGANLILLGELGSGKTTALCDLVSQVIKEPNKTGKFFDFLPIYIQASQLETSILDKNKPLESIIDTLQKVYPGGYDRNTNLLIRTHLDNGKVIFILDGLDEFPPELFNNYTVFLESLIEKYPRTHIIVAATPHYLGNLTRLGFVPVEIGFWNRARQKKLIQNWSNAWSKYDKGAVSPAITFSPTMLQEWLTSINKLAIPIELTLQVWLILNGNTKITQLNQTLDLYLNYACGEDDNNNIRYSLEKLALQIISIVSPVIKVHEIDQWEYSDGNKFVFALPDDDRSSKDTLSKYKASFPHKTTHHLLPLLDKNLIIQQTQENICFRHAIFTSYLAAAGLNRLRHQNGSVLTLKHEQLGKWETYIRTIGFYICQNDDTILVDRIITQNQNPINRELLILGSFLKLSPKTFQWHKNVMKELITLFRLDETDFGVKLRILIAILQSGESGIDIFIRDLSQSIKVEYRISGAYACGFVGKSNQIEILKYLVNDPSPLVQRASCLALSAINSQKAIELLSLALVRGSEDLKRVSAESLANIQEEGFEILQEASKMEDLTIRRASIFGLTRIQTQKAKQLLTEMHLSDSQWMVKDTASNALEFISHGYPSLPHPTPDPINSPWLIKFAADRGEGLSPGKNPIKILLLVLQEGQLDQKIAALEYLGFFGDKSVLPWIHEHFVSKDILLKTAAFKAIWFLTVQSEEIS